MDRFLPSLSRILLAILFLECLRHWVLFATGPMPLVLDAGGYWRTAQVVAEGDFFQQTVDAPFRTPFYAYYLAFFQQCFAENALWWAVVGQHVIVFATTLMTCGFAARLCRNRAGAVVCYLLLLVLPPRLWCANWIVTETIFTFLFTAGMGCLFLLEKRAVNGAASEPGADAHSSSRSAVVSGLLLGAATMIRPVPQLLIPALAVVLALSPWFKIRNLVSGQTLRSAGFMVAAFALCLLPCVIRNKVVYDEFFLTKLPAANKWAVAFRDGSGGDLSWPRTPAAREMEAWLNAPPGVLNNRHPYEVRGELEAAGLDRPKAEELMSRVSLDAIKSQPRLFLWRAIKRIGNFWRCVSDLPPKWEGLAANFQGQRAWRIPVWADMGDFLLRITPTQSLWWSQIFSLIAWVAALKLVWLPEHRWKGLVLVMTFSYFCLLTGLVEIENYRYRMVLEPLMILGIVTAFVPPQRNS